MSYRIIARSISRPVWERLGEGSFAARVLAVFEHVCDLMTPDGQVVALVLPQVGDGPLNIVVEAKPGDLAALEPAVPAWLEEGRLRVGGLEVALETAAVWEPCPDWEKLRARQDVCTDRLPLVKAFSLQHAPEGSVLILVSGRPGRPTDPALVEPPNSTYGVLFTAAREAAGALRRGWKGDAALLQAGAAQLAGLGGGLTPAGDDFLTGVMLWARLAHSSPRSLCRLLAEAAAPRTTTLSAAFLRAAARGECSAAWHMLLATLSEGTDAEVARAVREVLSHGATSGADALAGFLWAGLSVNG
jgi:hypothetical protein